jgi:hypothetical protein
MTGSPSNTIDAASEELCSASQSLMPGRAGSAIPSVAGASPHKSINNVWRPLMAASNANADAVTVVQLPPLGDMSKTDTKTSSRIRGDVCNGCDVQERDYKVTSLAKG